MEEHETGRKIKILPVLFLLVFFFGLISSVAAVPPQTPIPIQGYEIQLPQFDTLPQFEARTWHFHVFNASNFYPVAPNKTVGCGFDLYYTNNGQYVDHQTDVPSLSSDHWEFNIDSNNLSKVGHYSYIFFCNDTSQGGFVTSSFDVTPTGQTSNMGFFFLIFLIAYGIVVLGFYNKNIPLAMLGGVLLMGLGVFTLNNGIDIFRNQITSSISYITIAIGAIVAIVAGLESMDVI